MASSSGHVAALWAVDHNYFRHSRYTNNGWTSPYSEPSLSLASIGVAPNGDVLVIGRSTGASTNRNLVARWFRSPSGGELGEKEWDPERELLFQLEEGLSLLDNSLTIAPDSSVMVIWRIWEPPNAYRYMAIRHTESSGWLPVKEIEPTAGSSLVDLVADSEGNAFLYMSRFTNSIVLQYSKSSDSWDEINLATGSGADYAIALQPGGKATVLYRNKGDSNRIRMLRFD